MAKKSKASVKEESLASVEEETLVPYNNDGIIDFVLLFTVAGALLVICFIIGGILLYVV